MKHYIVKESMSLKIWRAVCYVVLTLAALLCLFFFYMLIISSTRTHSEIQQGFSFLPGSNFSNNFKSVIEDREFPILTGLWNSFLVSSLTALLSVYFSAMTAYAIHVYRFKGRNFVFNAILLIMTVPTQVSALGFIDLINDLGMRNTLWPLFLPAIAAPVSFFFMKQYMDSSLPLEIVEAARIDGSGEFRTFNQIVMPIMKPALAVQAIFTFVGAWNNYFVPALVIQTKNLKTVPILIANLRAKDWASLDIGQVYMMIMLAIMPVVVVYFALSKFIIAGVALGGVKE